MFRIAIGSCSCANSEKMKGVAKVACEQLSAKLQQLKHLSFSQLSNLPTTQTEELLIDGFKLRSAVQVDRLDSGLLVVVQLFHPTWKFPNYISQFGIGKKFVEGFVVDKSNEIIKASDELLWEYR